MNQRDVRKMLEGRWDNVDYCYEAHRSPYDLDVFEEIFNKANKNIAQTQTQTAAKPPSQPKKPKKEEKPVRTVVSSLEIETEDFALLPELERITMMRNTVRTDMLFEDDDYEWCHQNCSNLWYPNEEGNSIRFLSEDDKVLFLLARA